MNRIAQFAVKYPVTVLMLILGIVLLGFISFGKLGTDLFPDLNNPKIYIELKAGEKPPEEIEKNYVDQIESLSMRQSDVIQVSSVSQAGYATITVEYNWNKDMDEAFLDLQKVLNSFSQNSDLEDFSISQYDPNADPVMILGLKNESISNMDDIRKIAENYIRNELVRIEGIADVKLAGIEESEVVIETNKYILESFGLTPDAIAAQINNYNINVSGGSIVDMGLKYVVKGVSVIEDIYDLENIIVGFRQSSSGSSATTPNAVATSVSGRIPVYLKDVATIKFANKDPENIVTINGERCIGLSIYKEPKFNTVDAVKSLGTAISELERALPGYEFIRVQDQGSYIQKAIGEVQNTALLGILLAVFVLYIFLRRIGTTLVISVAIPVSIIATFNLMYFNHLTINIMTLGGLALGAGMLIDNAIVVLENITRNREAGLPLKESVIKGTGEVGGAITASTVTTIVVFLPIVYLHGASGEMFKDQAWTVAFSLLSSLVVAMLVIPMLVSTFFSDINKKSYATPPIQFNWYRRFLEKTIEKRNIVIFLSLLLMVLTGSLIPKLGSEFMPKSESAEFTLHLKLPEGTTLTRTEGTVRMTESIIRDLLENKIKMIYSQTGTDNTSTITDQTSLSKGENRATLKVILTDEFATRTDEAISLIGNYLKTIPDIEISFTREETALQSSLGTKEAPFILEISGEDYSEMERISEEYRTILMNNPGLYNITSSLDEGTPEVEVVIDRFKTSYYNVTVGSIVNQIRSYLSGVEAGNFEKDGEMKDITIKMGDISVSQLRDLLISAGNVKVTLSELADIKTIVSPREITRRNQARTCYIYAMVNKNIAFDKVVKEAEASLKPVIIPASYKTEFTGEELKRKESMSNLSFALILSLILVFMVMAAQFESVIQPFVIMLTIPLAGVGTILTFFLLGKTLNMMAYIGIIMLGGIAVNNAIILIDRINQLRDNGLGKKEAIVLAGTQRIRPILMTSLTTILALLPLTAGFGESVSLRAPMALAVIGGLVSSTLLTLVVIPCVYWVLDSFGQWVTGMYGKTGKSQ